MSRKSTNAHQKYTHIFNFVISMLYSGHADAALVSSLDSGYIYLWSCFYLWTTFCISLQSNCTMALGAGLCTTFLAFVYVFGKLCSLYLRHHLLFCGCHLLKALLWGLWIALFISPLLSLLCTLLCQYCHVLVSHLLCEKNYLWPGLVPILQFSFGQFFCPDCSLPVSVDGHLLVKQLNCQDCHLDLLVTRCFRKIVIYLWTAQTQRLQFTCEQFLSRWPFTCIIFSPQDSNLDNPTRPLSSKKSCTWSPVKFSQRFSSNLVKVHQ